MNIIFEAPERTMAIVFQQPTGQPMFVPGVAPQTAVAQPMPTMASGSVMYYPQMAGGAMIMVRARSSVLHDNSAYYVVLIYNIACNCHPTSY